MLIAVGLALLLLSACGVQSIGPGAGTSEGAASASHQAAPTVTATQPSTASPTESSGAARLRLLPGSSQYAPSDTITITVLNGSSTTVYAVAHSTDCSIILIQRLVADSWQPAHPCVNGYPHPVVTQIAAGATTTVQLPPMSAGNDAQPDASSQWPAGTYRAALTYTSSRSAALSGGQTILSATFVVG